MARYKRTRGILLRRIGSFFRRLFGLRSKEKYLDDEKIASMNQTEKDEPERLTILPEDTAPKTDTNETVEVRDVETEVEEKQTEVALTDAEPETISEPEVTAGPENDGDSFVNEDTFYSEY